MHFDCQYSSKCYSDIGTSYIFYYRIGKQTNYVIARCRGVHTARLNKFNINHLNDTTIDCRAIVLLLIVILNLL